MQVEHKITLLGPIPLDNITTWKNETFERYGCLTYPVIALSKLFGRRARITPVTHVRKKDQQTIKAILKGHPGVELLHINADFDQGDVMRLRFINRNKCLEKQYGFMNPILPDDVKHLLDSHFFLCLPVTDYEISLETLQFIKAYSEAKIIFDAHGQTMAMTTLGDRVQKFWVDRDLWLPYIDVLVMTIEQAKYCWFEKEYTLEELEDGKDLSEEEIEAFAGYCFKQKVQALYITLKDGGCLVYAKHKRRIYKSCVPAIELPEISVDTTGGEESFVAGLTYGLLETGWDFVKSARYGNIVSSQRAKDATYEVFDSLQDILKLYD